REGERTRATSLAALALVARERFHVQHPQDVAAEPTEEPVQVELPERPRAVGDKPIAEEMVEDEEIVEEPVLQDEPIEEHIVTEEPKETLEAGGKYGGRGRGRARLAQRGAPTANAISKGLTWLAKHQDPEGCWRAASFGDRCPVSDRCEGAGLAVTDVGTTGLALLAFLGDGSTLRTGPHVAVVRRAVLWLKQQQADNGMIGSEATRMAHYNHAIATYALAEAYGLSAYKPLERTVQQAVDYIEKARNPYKVWRYYARDGGNDSSVTTWMLLALSAAKDFKLNVTKDAPRYVEAWFEEVTDPSTGSVGYTKRGENSSRELGKGTLFPPDKTEALTAAGLFCRFLLGQTPQENPILYTAADTILKRPPSWNPDDGSIDLCYWLFGTMAMYQMGGRHWSDWTKSLGPALLDTQVQKGHAAGSWNPVSAWSSDGGRVFSTALGVLTLETYYRYTRLIR
ncbi:MAG: terpene cyclase/mutase family protein, partial [Planctomycetes bacterium]|nr:terpene cyclase/mutase family protein [Planctomycetota bacterium]